MKGRAGKLPYFQRAMLVIDEHSSTEGRHIYDSDNKGWKAVSNALKGRLFPDDDQYTLALSLLSTRSTENVCHITLLDLADAADFFAVHSGDYRDGDFYSGRWTHLTDTRPISPQKRHLHVDRVLLGVRSLESLANPGVFNSLWTVTPAPNLVLLWGANRFLLRRRPGGRQNRSCAGIWRKGAFWRPQEPGRGVLSWCLVSVISTFCGC